MNRVAYEARMGGGRRGFKTLTHRPIYRKEISRIHQAVDIKEINIKSRNWIGFFHIFQFSNSSREVEKTKLFGMINNMNCQH
jgi:hypothetical protein